MATAVLYEEDISLPADQSDRDRRSPRGGCGDQRSQTGIDGESIAGSTRP